MVLLAKLIMLEKEMYFNKKIFFIIIFIFIINNVSASIKENIIDKFNNIENISFNFEQNINGKIENGNCTIEYPKKIYCKYDLGNQKILVSNGKSLVIKTLSSYYLYPLEKTPLDSILNKDFLLNKIKNLDERNVGDNFINYQFVENENEINLFFDKKTFNLIGWQTIDIYQNISITYLSSIKRNQKLKKDLFILPEQN
jgi:outer membrane lipoprotein-sorting protein